MSLKEAPSRRVSALLFIIIVSLVAIGLSLFNSIPQSAPSTSSISVAHTWRLF